jgi:hypothetical protein
MNSPKVLFLRTDSSNRLLAATFEPWFEEAVIAAYAEMAYRQPRGSQLAEAWDQHSQLAGAKRFVEILCGLPLIEAAEEKKSTGLNYSTAPLNAAKPFAKRTPQTTTP